MALPPSNPFINENRFFELMSIRTEDTPPWLHHISRADIDFDLRGIDGFAFIEPKRGGELVRVPIQIVRSRGKKSVFVIKHPGHRKSGMIIVMVNSTRSDEVIRRYIHERLTEIWEREIDFSDFIHRIVYAKLSPNGHKFRTELEYRRGIFNIEE